MKALIDRSRVRKQSIGLQLGFKFTEHTGVKCDLHTDAEPEYYFNPFSWITVTSVTVRSNHKANKHAEKQIAL